MKLFKSKILQNLLTSLTGASIVYLGFFFAMNVFIDQDKKFLIQARENLDAFSCNFEPEQINFYEEKLALFEEEVNKITKLDHILIIPYAYKTELKEIYSQTVSIPNISASIGSYPTIEKKYSLNDLRDLIDEQWKTDYSTILNFRKC